MPDAGGSMGFCAGPAGTAPHGLLRTLPGPFAEGNESLLQFGDGDAATSRAIFAPRHESV